MSRYEIQGLFFGLLVSSMLKIAVIINTLILGCSWLYIERILGFQKSPSSCHVTILLWHNHFINPTWQQTKLASWHVTHPFVPRNFQCSILCPTFTYRATNYLQHGTILHSLEFFHLFINFFFWALVPVLI